MRARQPALDFGASLPHWTRDIELSHMLNGISVVVMELEPFMNRVMRRARHELPADDPLYGDLETFVRQEANHTLLHRQYNQALYDAGYQGIEEIERMMREDYTRYLKEWPLRELLAYCEGFECLGPIWAEFLFEAVDDLFEGADPAVVDLWRWHLAEEYEHRMVAYSVYHRFGGHWLHRLVTTFKTHRHLQKYGAMCGALLLAADRKSMTPEQVAESKAKSANIRRRLSLFILKRLWRVVQPFYSPEHLKKPAGIEHYLSMP